MMTARQRNATLKRLYDYFNSCGKILTEKEYRESGGPVRMVAISRGFKNYNSAVALLKKRYPLWELAASKVEVAPPIPEPKTEEVKLDPLASLAKKVKEKEEIVDEDE